MSPELSEKLTVAVDSVPAFPKSVQEILALTRNFECAPKDLVQVIENDPVVTVRVLRVINSAYFRLPKKTTSIKLAVVYLGFNTIKNLALGIAAIGMVSAHHVPGLDNKAFLQHALSTASIAKLLAQRVDGADPMDCFVAGLLHDFGKLLLAQTLPAEFQKALDQSRNNQTSLHLALREIMGVDHDEIGAMLVSKWRFPVDLVEAIRHQYGPEVQDAPMTACVFAANQISKKLQFGCAGNYYHEALPPAIAKRLGGGLDELMASLGDLTPVFEEAKQFSNI